MASAMNVVFNKLEKYDGQKDLTKWFRKFEQCCLVANKTDDTVKGQLLMLFVEGQAKAALKELEELKAEPQTLTSCKERLKTVFDTVTIREDKMALFETRTQQLGESKDEFMLALLRLYHAGNPGSAPDLLDQALKRKFLEGIDPELKRGIFVFCNDPYDRGVSRDKLLQDCRKAKVHLTPSNADQKLSSDHKDTVNAVEFTPNNELVNALSNLTTTLSQHIQQTTEKLAAQDEKLNALVKSTNQGDPTTHFSGSRFNNFRSPHQFKPHQTRWQV